MEIGVETAKEINMSEIDELYDVIVRRLPEVKGIYTNRERQHGKKKSKELNKFQKIAAIAAINNGIKDVPPLDLIFDDVTCEEFIKNVRIEKYPRTIEPVCVKCKRIEPYPNPTFKNLCLECVYEYCHVARFHSSNIIVLCRAVIRNEIPDNKFIKTKNQPEPAKLFPKNKISINQLHYDYDIHIPESHPYAINGSELPDSYTKFMLNVYNFRQNRKLVSGYFSVKLSGNYFCTNFVTGRVCASYETNESRSKIFDVALSDITIRKKVQYSEPKAFKTKKYCRSCIFARNDARHRYGTA